ncbi:MAG TPA: GNAT family N-acetyltransferase [Azonexus sp.]|nr:GNAT family N-acetyltransferase [Azonexus sp.]
MSDSIDDTQFSRPATLRDGRPVTIRLMHPDDKDKLVAAFAKLDRQSVYTRFFSFRKELPEGPLNRIDRIDFVHLAALVVTLGVGADAAIIGSATYVADDDADGAKAAEVAFTIEEDFQGQGLAGQLLSALAGIARRHGIKRFDAEVLAHNAAMLAVFRRSGLPVSVRHAGGVVHVSLDLLQLPG